MPPPVDLPKGAITFEPLAEIATGETARVDLCRGTGPNAGALYAVKRLHRHIAEDPQFSAMFQDEVWMTAALKHRNVVEVAGWGTDREGTYLAVELVQGVSLARLMKTVFDTGEVFSERMVMFIAAEISAGLAEAHALRAPSGELLGLVHRDLTPGNILLSFSGQVKIADFGLAKAKQRLTQTLTGLLKGKPQYMAPEQARGAEIDSRADQFALGVLMFELLSGRRPWSATSELQIMHVTANEPPLDLKELRPKIDKEIVGVVMRCLQKDPAARFGSTKDLHDKLVDWLTVHGYMEGSDDALARFVRRNAMRQMRWFERAIAGELLPAARVPSPRVPSYSGHTGVPSAPVDPARRARVKSRRAVTEQDADADGAEVTEVEPRVPTFGDGAKEPRRAPAQVAQGAQGAQGANDGWGEEVPTLVQKASTPFSTELARSLGKRPAPAPAAGAPAVRGAPPRATPPPTVMDEDSDQRTTAVKRHPLLRGNESAGPPQVPTLPSPRVNDPDSEDVSTIPLGGVLPAKLQAAVSVAARQARASEAQPAPPARGAASSPFPGQVVPPDPSAPPPPNGPRFNAPPLASAAQDAGRASFPPAAPNDLASEAERMKREAGRLGEEAQVAAQEAQRKAAIARLAADAARYAAEALRTAAAGATPQANARLETARAIWSAIERGEIDPAMEAALSVPPSSGRPSMPPAQVPTQPLMDLQRALPLPPPAAHPVMGHGAPLSHAPPAMSHGAPSMPPPGGGNLHGGTARMSLPPPSAFGTVPMSRPASSDLLPAGLRPELFGLPVPLVVALAFGAFFLLLVLIWVLAG